MRDRPTWLSANRTQKYLLTAFTYLVCVYRNAGLNSINTQKPGLTRAVVAEARSKLNLVALATHKVRLFLPMLNCTVGNRAWSRTETALLPLAGHHVNHF